MIYALFSSFAVAPHAAGMGHGNGNKKGHCDGGGL